MLDDSIVKQREAEQERESAELKVLEVSRMLVMHNSLCLLIRILWLTQLREEITVKSQELDRENRRKAKLEKDFKTVQVTTCYT